MMMAETLESLQVKIAHIEQELAEVRQSLEQLLPASQPPVKEHRLAGIEWVDRRGWKVWFDEWFQQTGVTVQPIGAEKLQALMRQEGIRPADNLLSRGIIDMREE
jgi:hypothetical protein